MALEDYNLNEKLPETRRERLDRLGTILRIAKHRYERTEIAGAFKDQVLPADKERGEENFSEPLPEMSEPLKHVKPGQCMECGDLGQYELDVLGGTVMLCTGCYENHKDDMRMGIRKSSF